MMADKDKERVMYVGRAVKAVREHFKKCGMREDKAHRASQSFVVYLLDTNGGPDATDFAAEFKAWFGKDLGMTK
jgi:hypothetical protein